MSLTYILGGPGTGKSRLLMERLIESSMRQPNTRHIMLVPEQFTMQTQRNIIALHPRHAIMNIDILSFERLAYRVFGEAGREDIHILTDMGKNMLLRKASAEHQDELLVFRRSLRKPGFISRLMSLLSEFYQYGITQDQLAAMTEEMDSHPLLKQKLKDLQTFYSALNDHKGDDSLAAEEVLSLLLRLLPASDFLEGAVIAMDHFTGFTTVQYQLLKVMLKQAGNLEMAFLIPEKDWRDETRPEDLFHMSQSAIFAMNGLAKECHVDVKMHFCREAYRYQKSPELAFLAEHFLHPEYTAYESETLSSIRALSFRNPAMEADYAASTIALLVREEGLRYRDIAVVTGDLEEYRDFLEPAFRKYHIPAFMDRKKGIMGNPLVEYLRSAIAIFPEDFSYEAVFRYLKCGIPILPREELDLVDNYCLACGIRGQSHWKNPWDRQWSAKIIPDFEGLNKARQRVWDSLQPIRKVRKMKDDSAEGNKPSAVTVADRTGALREMMDLIQAPARMEEMALAMEAMDNKDLAQEYRMVCDYLLQLLDQMDQLLGREVLTLQEFSDILDAGLAEAKLGRIPGSLDRVQVGDVMRSRLHEIRVLIVLGFNDGSIPGQHASGGILSEEERELLEQHQMTLAPTAGIVANQDRFYLYTLLTKPSERLILTASRMGMDGNARRVSYIFRSIQKLFPGLTMEEGDSPTMEILYSCRQKLWESIADHMALMKQEALAGNMDPWMDLAQCLFADDPEKMRRMIQANFSMYMGSSLTRAGAKALYGSELTGSVTRLETYARCAYAHFLDYGLQLMERANNQVKSDQRGSFFHKTLEVFFRLLKQKKLSYKAISQEECRALVEEAVRTASETEGIIFMEENGKTEYLKKRWTQMADHTVDMILRFLNTEDFAPEAFELYFDGYGTPAMRMRFSEEEQMILRGIVDRLDHYRSEEADRLYLRVVDYKTGHLKLDSSMLYDGLQMQLPMYLEAVMDRAAKLNPETEVLPGGIYYYVVEDPCVDLTPDMTPEMVENERAKKLQMNGLTLNLDEVKEHMGSVGGQKVTTDQFEALRHHVRRKAVQYASEIMEGNISAEPYELKKNTGCDYCPFSGVCGFRPRREGYHYRKVKRMKDKDMWAKLEEEDQDHAMDS